MPEAASQGLEVSFTNEVLPPEWGEPPVTSFSQKGGIGKVAYLKSKVQFEKDHETPILGSNN